MGGDRKLNEALQQALKLEADQAESGPSARLRIVTGTPVGASQPTYRRRGGEHYAVIVGPPVTFAEATDGAA